MPNASITFLLVARNTAKLAAQCRQLAAQYDINTQYIAADLATPTAPTQIFAEAQQRGLAVVVLLNNAGIGSGGEFSHLALDAELSLIQLNVSALVALTHLFLPPMQARRAAYSVALQASHCLEKRCNGSTAGQAAT